MRLTLPVCGSITQAASSRPLSCTIRPLDGSSGVGAVPPAFAAACREPGPWHASQATLSSDHVVSYRSPSSR